MVKAEAPRYFELGANTAKIIVDREGGKVSKLVGRLVEFQYGLTHTPEEEDYHFFVGRSNDLLQDERWGFSEMIPAHSLRTAYGPGGCECWIDMEFIAGTPLSMMERVPENTACSLAHFLQGCVRMARTTKEETGRIILPDLLGGVKNPATRFNNFMVDENDRLHFVDVYPLAVFNNGRDPKKGKYKDCLTLAAGAVNHPKVIYAVGRLKQAL